MENKFTDNEIVKALECCCKSNTNDYYCEDCPYEHIELCAAVVSKDALDFINRQKTENERLNVELVGMRGACESYKIHYDNARAEIEKLKEQLDGETVKNMRLGHEVERLNAVSEICGDCHKQYAEKIERAKSEARKELADNIINSVYGFYSSIGIREVVEEIVKKMEGENNVQISH